MVAPSETNDESPAKAPSSPEAVKPKPLAELHPQLDDFKREVVVGAIDDITTKIRLSYSERLAVAAKALSASDDEQSANALQFLSCIMQAMLKSSDASRPFHPMFESGDKRGLIPDDFDDEQVALICELSTHLKDSVIQARLSDIAWLRIRSLQYAEQAIQEYLRSAERLIAEESKDDTSLLVLAFEFIERAVRLCLYAFKEEDHPSEPVEILLSFGPTVFDRGQFHQVLRAEELLFDMGLSDVGSRVEFVERVAVAAEGDASPHTARGIWLFLAKLYKSLSDTDSERDARIRAAEIMVNLGEMVATGDPPSFMAAAAHVSDALKIYRQVPGESTRKEELRRTLADYQSRINEEMSQHSTEVDLSEPAQEVRNKVSGQSLADALAILAFFISPTALDSLERQVWEQAEKFPLQYHVSISVSDRDGRTVETIPPLLGDRDEKEKGKALKYHMMRQADFRYSMISAGVVEPARAKIWEEHYLSPEVLVPLAEQSSFVPDGHERLFAKGLAAGLEGDYAVALHILVPQLENALREMLKRLGYVVNTKEKDDQITQEALTLNTILRADSLRDVLGEGVHFDLEALLSDKLGASWRHNIAHGLTGDAAYSFGGNTPYIFWLILRLVILPLIPECSEEVD